jgi:hypothetical protein
MRLLLARLLYRLRGPLNVAVFSDGIMLEGEPVLMRCHRRYITVWCLWFDREWQGSEKVPYVELHIYRVPWRKVDYTFQQIGGEGD